MKRILLFVGTNLAVMLVLGIASPAAGRQPLPHRQRPQPGQHCWASPLIMGFGGAIISLLMSKPMAKWSTGAQIINGSTDPTHRWIVGTVEGFAKKRRHRHAGGGDLRGRAQCLCHRRLQELGAGGGVHRAAADSMNREEVEAVIGHEVAHVANGDMVTMTLIQGVMNTFVVFISRVVGYFVDKRGAAQRPRRPGHRLHTSPPWCMDLVLGMVAAIIVAWFSRQREYRADAGAAELMGRKQPMINALARLGGLDPGELPKTVATMGINGRPSGLMALFSSHPPIEERIRALQAPTAQ
jgi:heat shock protein HtpX